MPMRYVAHGLQVISPFALPAMSERSERSLPTLELDLFTRPSVEADWSARDARPIWEGRLGDGETLLVSGTCDGRYLFAFGEKALFGLDHARERLACAPSEAGVAWQRTLLTKLLPNIAILRGYEALHASAVASPEGAVVVLAPSGTGKTALALALAGGGWPLISDDILVLRRDSTGVHAHPGTPHLNVDREGRRGRPHRDVAQVLGILGGELWLAARSLATEPRPVAAVCLLERGLPGPLEIHTLAATPLALAPYMLGLADGQQRERERFGLYGELVADCRCLRIRAGRNHTPTMIAEHLRAHLAVPAESLSGAAR
jgi:hypothetical protein